ncbi:MAG: PEP-CTERM sorting domain-containing protein [Planctomycetia bacterium]|nr:MAG: PEP-CTERM sorting domain-containing protein [Planctomycetia bacterium]
MTLWSKAVAVAAVGGMAALAAANIRINEIRTDNPGGDINEYFELWGAPGASLNGLTYIVIGDGAGGSGTIENVTPLTGFSIPADGYFLAAEATLTVNPSQIDLTLSASALNFENDDNYTHMLVRGFSGALNLDVDTNDDGILDLTPWAEIIDVVAFIGEGADQIYTSTTVGPDPIKGSPWHLWRLPNGLGSWNFDSFDNGTPTAQTDLVNYATDTPGVANPEPASLALFGIAVLMLRRR